MLKLKRLGHLDDADLVEQAREGSSRAAGELARRHWDELFRVAHLILRDVPAAEDVTQEALIAALSALEQFDNERPIRPWLVKILTNKALDSGRALSRHRDRNEISDTLDRSDVAPADEIGRGDLREGLELLDPVDRTLLILRYVLDYRSSEIGELLDMPEGTVRSRLKRALDQLRTKIEVETR